MVTQTGATSTSYRGFRVLSLAQHYTSWTFNTRRSVFSSIIANKILDGSEHGCTGIQTGRRTVPCSKIATFNEAENM